MNAALLNASRRGELERGTLKKRATLEKPNGHLGE
jgi:hypothetical protein